MEQLRSFTIPGTARQLRQFFVYTPPSRTDQRIDTPFKNGYIFRYVPVLIQAHLSTYQRNSTVLRYCFNVFYCIMGTFTKPYTRLLIRLSQVRAQVEEPNNPLKTRKFSGGDQVKYAYANGAGNKSGYSAD